MPRPSAAVCIRRSLGEIAWSDLSVLSLVSYLRPGFGRALLILRGWQLNHINLPTPCVCPMPL